MKPDRRTLLSGLASTAAVALAPRAAHAAPKAEPWPLWEAHDAQAAARIDHRPWRRFLARNLVLSEDGINRVTYGVVSDSDRRLLDGYVADLAATDIAAYNRFEQYAYWINLYNALTMQVILDHYPVDSILDISISPGFFSTGPWGKKLVTVAGEELSLDDMEHRILRPIWRDARIHYAVNCAALGCPNLQASPYTGANIEPLLTIAAKGYVNHPRGAALRDGKLYVSKLYDWYADDFGGSDEAVINHLERYARPGLKTALKGIVKISGSDYDWALNDAPKKG